MRASALRVQPRATATSALPGTVELAEISGSDTFVHVDTAGRRAGGATAPACTTSTLGAPITLYLDPAQVYVFDADGDAAGRARRASAEGS